MGMPMWETDGKANGATPSLSTKFEVTGPCGWARIVTALLMDRSANGEEPGTQCRRRPKRNHVPQRTCKNARFRGRAWGCLKMGAGTCLSKFVPLWKGPLLWAGAFNFAGRSASTSSARGTANCERCESFESKHKYSRKTPVVFLVILNRWGNTIYDETSTDLLNMTPSWDGGNASDGVYFYRYEGVGVAGQELDGHGFLHLIRD